MFAEIMSGIGALASVGSGLFGLFGSGGQARQQRALGEQSMMLSMIQGMIAQEEGKQQAMLARERGQAEAEAANYNVAQLSQQLYLSTVQGFLQQFSIKNKMDQTTGAQRAGYGASGVSTTEGSAQDVMQQSAYTARYDQQMTEYGNKIVQGRIKDQINWQIYGRDRALWGAEIGADMAETQGQIAMFNAMAQGSMSQQMAGIKASALQEQGTASFVRGIMGGIGELGGMFKGFGSQDTTSNADLLKDFQSGGKWENSAFGRLYNGNY